MAEGDDGLRVGRQVGESRPAVASSSIVVVRDRAEASGAEGPGYELFMLERHIETDFAGGALVFPGGKLAPGDGDLDAARWSGVDPAAEVELLGAADAGEALALRVSAVREAFEEAGVLFAERRDGTPLTAEDLLREDWLEVRRRLASRGDDWDWRPWLEAEDLVLQLGALAFHAWWVTPEGLHRRYDTRFFVAHVPDEQARALGHDDVEMTSSAWLTPQEALEAGRTGRSTVIYPTRKNLEALAEYGSADELLRAAREGRTDRRRLQPVIVEVDGRPMVRHPDGGDPEPG